MKKNKITVAIAATLLMTSGSALSLECPDREDGISEAIHHIPAGEIDALDNFLPADDWGHGTIEWKDKDRGITEETPMGIVPAYGAFAGPVNPGWVRFLDGTRTKEEDGFSTTAPAGDDGNHIYMNHGRESHANGIYRKIGCIDPLGQYDVSARGATIGSFVWAFGYSKVDAPFILDNDNEPTERRKVSYILLNKVAESNNAW